MTSESRTFAFNFSTLRVKVKFNKNSPSSLDIFTPRLKGFKKFFVFSSFVQSCNKVI